MNWIKSHYKWSHRINRQIKRRSMVICAGKVICGLLMLFGFLLLGDRNCSVVAIISGAVMFFGGAFVFMALVKS